MPFDNPIVGGTALVRAAIKSPNYVPGVSGWSINRDGTAEFASASIRGNVVIVGNTTSGNIEIASQGGYATIQFYNIAHTDFARIATQDINGSPQLVIAGGLRPSIIGPGDPDVRSVIKQEPLAGVTYIGASANLSGTPVIGGQVQITDVDASLCFVDSTNTFQATLTAGNGGITYFHDFSTTGGGFSWDKYANAAGTADWFTQIGWGLWQNISFQNGWSNLGSGNTNGQYRMDCEGRVELRGVIIGGTKTDGTVMFNLPAPFRPPKTEVLPICMISGGAGSNVQIRVSTGGDVTCFGISASTTGNMSLGGTTFSVRP